MSKILTLALIKFKHSIHFFTGDTSQFLPPVDSAASNNEEDDDFDEYDYEDYLEEELDHADEDFAFSTTANPSSLLPHDLEAYNKKLFEGFGATEKTESSSDSLPKFLLHPSNGYIIRGKSATLRCAATSADKAYFACNGEAMAASSRHKEKDKVLDSKSVVKELTLEVTRDDVEEFFGRFRCRCEAWNSKGRTTSRNVTVETACESFFKSTVAQQVFPRDFLVCAILDKSSLFFLLRARLSN